MSSVSFTEEMKGYVTLGATDYGRGAEEGKADGNFLMFHLTIATDDIEAFMEDRRREATAEGWVESELFGGRRPVEKGVFNLFVDTDDPTTKNMLYRLFFSDGAGNPLTLCGFKVIRDDPGSDMWSDTTTLYTRILSGHVEAAGDESAEVVAAGIITIWLKDFARQLTTFRAHGGSPLERAEALGRFGRLFMGELWDVYGRHRRHDVADADQPAQPQRPLRLGAPEVHTATTSDGVDLRLTRYRGGSKGPVILAPGFGSSTLVLATGTVDTNLPEYLYERGYDVWLFDHRASPLLPSASTQFTADDLATRDWPAAIDSVRSAAGAGDVQVVAHGAASMALNMALAAGVSGVRSAVSSQVALTPKVAPSVRLRALLHVASLLRRLGATTVSGGDRGDKRPDRALEQVARLSPGRARCASPACRRVFLLYGEVFRHDQLNEATHQAVHTMFGVANLTFLEHMSRIVAKGKVVDAEGNDTYLPHLGDITVPVTYVHGEFNRLFLPVGTKLTYQLLTKANGPGPYRRLVFPNYAHLDTLIGKHAWRDVFPSLHGELERYN